MFRSDSNERAHFWLPDSELTSTHEMLETPVGERMYIDQGEVIRVRVETDEFFDDEPGPPKMAEGVQVQREVKRAPYNIIVSINLPASTFGIDLIGSGSVPSPSRVLGQLHGGMLPP